MKNLNLAIKKQIDNLFKHFDYSYIKNTSLVFIALAYYIKNEEKLNNKLETKNLTADDIVNGESVRKLIHVFQDWLKNEKSEFNNIYSESFEYILLGLERNELGNKAVKDYLVFLLQTVESNHSKKNEDIIPEILESVLSILAEIQLKAAGESYTPKYLTSLLVRLLNLIPGETLFDPVCGSGSFLTYANKIIKPIGSISVFGSDVNLDAIKVAKLNMLINHLDPKNVTQKDTLLDLTDSNSKSSIERYDAICADPPFSLRNWSEGSDEFSLSYTFKFGMPPKSNADYAFIQTVLAKLKERGRATLLTSQGVLFRGGQEQKIRKRLLQEGCIDSVIHLSSNLLPNTRIPVSIIILRKSSDLKDVLFINATDEFEVANRRNILSEANINHIVNLAKKRKSEIGISRLVELEEIEKNNFNLSVTNYIQKDQDATQESLEDLLEKQEDLYRRFNNIQSNIFNLIGDS